jgi:luciferase family oxidoreductase group 1
VEFSVLDQSLISEGRTPAEAIHETLRLAETCDRLGYVRFWCAEHHSSPGVASACPEILVGQLANRTSRIRVGAGGVMLTHYSPLKVAEAFRLLEAIHPGRIDLGLGRSPGADKKTAAVLRNGAAVVSTEGYAAQVREVVGFLTDGFDDGHPFGAIRAMPSGVDAPPVYLLGGSIESAELAGGLGAGLAVPYFMRPDLDGEIATAYRRAFAPSAALRAPRVIAAVPALCAETRVEAERLFSSRCLMAVRADRGLVGGGVPSVEEALGFDYTARERRYLADQLRGSLVGGPAEVGRRLAAVARRLHADEVMIVTVCHSFEHRVRSYELLARQFGLGAASRAATAGRSRRRSR